MLIHSHETGEVEEGLVCNMYFQPCRRGVAATGQVVRGVVLIVEEWWTIRLRDPSCLVALLSSDVKFSKQLSSHCPTFYLTIYGRSISYFSY